MSFSLARVLQYNVYSLKANESYRLQNTPHYSCGCPHRGPINRIYNPAQGANGKHSFLEYHELRTFRSQATIVKKLLLREHDDDFRIFLR